jgi:hypothetical protein
VSSAYARNPVAVDLLTEKRELPEWKMEYYGRAVMVELAVGEPRVHGFGRASFRRYWEVC